MTVLTSDWKVLPGTPCELGEGIRLVGDGPGDGLVMVDILAGRRMAVEPRTELLVLDVPLSAVAPWAGGWIAAAGTGIALLAPGSTPTRLARPEQNAPIPMRMNDGVADPHGRFWAGSMAYDGTPRAGSLYRVDPDGSVHRALPGLAIPNGPAFDTDRYTPAGQLAESIPVPVQQPTSVLITPDHRVLVTSATIGLPETGPTDGTVLAATAAVAGRRAAAWHGAATGRSPCPA
jgi:sugar lactone lactonase YvrE